MDSKTQIKKLNWAESSVFLIIENHCDIYTYLFLHGSFCWCFRGISQVLIGSFKGISRVFLEGFKCIGVVLQGGFMMSLVKKGLFLCI